MKTNAYCVVFCTCPDAESAKKIANHITQIKLATCTNIIPHLNSIYFWENKLTEGTEVLMVIKTRQEKLEELEKAVLALHPYKFPEFIALPIIYGNKHYLEWMDEAIN